MMAVTSAVFIPSWKLPLITGETSKIISDGAVADQISHNQRVSANQSSRAVAVTPLTPEQLRDFLNLFYFAIL
jgi:hypothetical protein